ncbi:TonB-dependent receptor plug domain-containing protein [Polaribacter porphyrae]|uniref:TonB-dependent receptor plug domain-containing protein n=1 Tax=Polaribacter porphyrae TaxID=1137780 RepID=A0A2S7WU38_9FLAO|nr:TonB-dependent receptor plug domain-containing protein [Polaribacter porphyrae]PQJ80832.1 hypothetical protein BTO18_17365 [Polaribacter porphyrae]
MKKYTTIIILLLFVSFKYNAQNITIKTVDENNKPVVGAVILFDNIKQKRWTNSKGVLKISFKAQPNVISAFHQKIGITKINYKGEKKITIKIKKGNDKIISKNSPKQKHLNSNQFNTIYDYIRGNVPGVNISTNNIITIRGVNSINGNISPLFVLDGNYITQDAFGVIPVLEIKSISVLKGPETARYGVRGANGVIIVKTF